MMGIPELIYGLCIISLLPEWSIQQRTQTYQMETNCNKEVRVQLGETVFIKVGGMVSPVAVGQCYIRVSTGDKYRLKTNVKIVTFKECTVQLTLYYSSTKIYRCDSYPTNTEVLAIDGSQVMVDFKKTNQQALQYSFEVSITPDEYPYVPDSTESQPVAPGLIVGIVCGIFAFIIFWAIIGACCYRKAQKNKRLAEYNSSNGKIPLEHTELGTVGYHGSENSYDSSPRPKTKLLYEERNMTDGKEENRGGIRRPQTLDIKSNNRTNLENEIQSKKSTSNNAYEHEEDPYDTMEGDPKPPKSPFLSALQNNPKFRKSRDENEKDAEDRQKRLSGSSFGNQTQESYSSAESQGRPPLPSVPSNSKPLTLAEKRKKMESFRRATRPDSYSSEDAIGTGPSGEETDDLNVSRSDRSRSDRSQSSGEKIGDRKPDTRHTLKPNRGAGQDSKGTTKVGNKEKNLSERTTDSPKFNRAGQFQKYDDGLRGSKRSNDDSIRGSKRSSKSPKAAAKGFGHRRTNSRPTTPTSMMRDDEDLESLPPLQRTSSRQSLYASRSSLYSRRRRKGSFSESVVSGSTYAHDDIDYYRRSRGHSRDYDDDSDGYVEPITRHQKDRMFKSLGDLEVSSRAEKATRSTQTLRETATQTGQDQSVEVHSKRVVRRKKRSKSLSAAGTQTSKVEENKTKEDPDTDNKVKPKKRSRSKNRNKSRDDSDSDTDLKYEKEKMKSKSRESLKDEKPRPKPRPRKSQSTNQAADESDGGKKAERKKSKRREKSTEKEINNDQSENVTETQPDPVPQTGVVMYPAGPQGQPLMMPYGLPPGYSTLPPNTGHPPYAVHGHVPYGAVPPQPGAQIRPPPPSYQQGEPAHVPGKPRKSNWEMLCEMTDQKPNEEIAETGSVASSVFTNNASAYPVMYPAGQYPPQVMPPNSYPHPLQSHSQYVQNPASTIVHPSLVPPSINIHAGPSSIGTASHPSPSLAGSEIHPEERQVIPQKSSWDALTELSERQKQLQANLNPANESVV